MITNLDQIGAEAIRLMTGADRDVKKAQAHIKQVWEAYTAAEEVGKTVVINGAKNKTEWAKLINRSTRYCQMIAKDGSRERSKKEDANRVRPMALLKELITVVSTGSPNECIDKANAICGQINWFPKAWTEKVEDSQDIPRRKKEEKKPIKHAKDPKGHYSAWCGTSLTNNNTAHQQRHATCPYCIAAMAADIRVVSPEPERRRLERELLEVRARLKMYERMHMHALRDGNKGHEDYLLTLREEVAELERKIAALKEIKTPEQAVAVAKKATAEREVQRKAEADAAAGQRVENREADASEQKLTLVVTESCPEHQ